MYSPVTLLAVIGILVGEVSGHGRMIDPPGRSSAWRYGFNTAKNYNDMGLNCGGKSNQWGTNGGKCGVCGDPYQQAQPRDNELGGKFGSGTIVKTYREGEQIKIDVELTANHKGWFEFRLCPDPRGTATHECLNRHLLETDRGTRWSLPDTKSRVFSVSARLPRGVSCDRCVLQWLYNAGNSYGTSTGGASGVGLGAQEQFINCADVAIKGSGNAQKPSTGFQTAPPKVTTKTTAGFLLPTTPKGSTCKGRPGYRISDLDKWCAFGCGMNYCAPQCLCP